MGNERYNVDMMAHNGTLFRQKENPEVFLGVFGGMPD